MASRAWLLDVGDYRLSLYHSRGPHLFSALYSGTCCLRQSVKMTSVKKPKLPYPYYFLPFCRPAELQHTRENLGMMEAVQQQYHPGVHSSTSSRSKLLNPEIYDPIHPNFPLLPVVLSIASE